MTESGIRHSVEDVGRDDTHAADGDLALRLRRRATLAEALDASRAARAEADDESVADQSRGVA